MDEFKLYRKKNLKCRYFTKKEYILIQELLFKLGYRWINQYNTENQVIDTEHEDNGYLIVKNKNQIYAGCGFSEYSSYQLTDAIEIKTTIFIKFLKQRIKEKYIISEKFINSF